MPCCAHAVSEVSIPSGAAMRMPVPISELITASAPLTSITLPATAARPKEGVTALSAISSPRDWEFNL